MDAAKKEQAWKAMIMCSLVNRLKN
jgi:hypothetical protein